MVRLARVTLRVAVGLGPRDALLLAAPGVVIGGVADVVVDEECAFWWLASTSYYNTLPWEDREPMGCR